jgi:hypothetical protein
MAEFCKECFLKYNPKYAGYHLRLSRDKDLCEGCGKWKKVVETIDRGFLFDMIGIFGKNDNKDDD